MYLVEPGSGQHKAYGSVHELGAAIRRGQLGAEALIYHRATSQWLPITVHPEYRRVVAEHERRSALAMRMRQWTFLAGDEGAQMRQNGAAEVHPPEQGAAAVGAPDRPSRSWLGSAIRRLRGLGS